MSAFVLSIVGALLASLVYSEFQAWAPRLASKLTALAVARAPRSKRERLAEEWAAHLVEIPGSIGQLMVAIGFLIAASSLRRAERKISRALTGRTRMVNFAAGAFGFAFVAPLFIIATLVVKFESRGPAIYRRKAVWPDGSVGTTYFVRSQRMTEDGGGQTFSGAIIDQLGLNILLSGFIGSMKGDVDFVGVMRRALFENR